MEKNKQDGMYTNYRDKTNSYIDFFYCAFRNALLILVPLLVISIFILSAPNISADNTSSDSISLTLDVACTINGVVVAPHTATLNAGQVDHSVGDTKLSVFCNDDNGYNIYAVGSSGDIDGNTDLIYALNQNYNIKTGVHDSNDSNSPSSWGMKLTAGTGTATGSDLTPPTIVNGYDSYSLIPSNYALVANRTSGTSMTTNTNVSGSYLNTTYQIYANSVQPAGTYNGKVKYLILHPYDSRQAVTSLDAAFALAGKQKVYQDETGSYFAMQDMDSTICNSVTITGEATTTQLVDLRDNRLYYVTKLADGHCWMTQNLDLDIGGVNTAPLNSNNTDISVAASGSGIYNAAGGYSENSGIWTWTPASTAITSTHTISDNSVSNWENSTVAPYSVEGGDVYYYTDIDNTFDSLAECVNNGYTEAECKHYHRGNYYNWTAAVASNASGGISDNYINAGNSICPKGWRLPVANSENQSIYEFGDLFYTYYGITMARFNTTTITDKVSYLNDGFNKIRRAPLWLVRSGYISNNTLNGSAVNGSYWSSTVVSSGNAYRLRFDGSGVWPSSSGYGGSGWSVRCIAR